MPVSSSLAWVVSASLSGVPCPSETTAPPSRSKWAISTSSPANERTRERVGVEPAGDEQPVGAGNDVAGLDVDYPVGVVAVEHVAVLDEQPVTGVVERPWPPSRGDDASDRSGAVEAPAGHDRLEGAEADQFGAVAGGPQ